MPDLITQLIHPWAIPAAKIVFSLFLLFLSFLGLMLLINYQRIMQSLKDMENSVNIERDDVMFNFTVARSNLKELQSKLSFPILEAAAPRLNDIISHVGALAFLFIRRDPNLLNWGGAIVNLTRSAYGYFKNRHKQYNM